MANKSQTTSSTMLSTQQKPLDGSKPSESTHSTRPKDDQSSSTEPPSYDSIVDGGFSRVGSTYINDLRELAHNLARNERWLSGSPARIPRGIDEDGMRNFVRDELAAFLGSEGIRGSEDLHRYSADSITSVKIRSWSKKHMKVPLSSTDMAFSDNLDQIALHIAEKKFSR